MRAIAASRSGVVSRSSDTPSSRGSLVSERATGRKSATAAAMTRASNPAEPSGERVVARSAASRSAVEPTSTTIRTRRQRDLDVGRDDRDPGAAIERGRRDGRAHPSGRAIADEADRVDGLARAAGRHHDVAAGEVGVAGGRDERRPGGRVGGTDRAIGDGRRRPRPRSPRARQAARRPTAPTPAARSRARRSCSRTRAAARRWRRSPGGSTCRRPSPARRRPAPRSRGRSRSRRRPPGRWPSRRASGRSPVRRRSHRPCRRRRCDRSGRRAGGRAARSRPGGATARRMTAGRRSGSRTASASPRRRRPRRAAGAAARPPCRPRSSR